MKKVTFFGVFTFTLLIAVVYGTKAMRSNSPRLTELALENVEALAQNESGTNVGYCYLQQSFASSSGYKKFCDSRTNDTKIYPCQSSETYGSYSESAKDRCTK